MITNTRLYTIPTLTAEQWLEIEPVTIPTRKLAYSQSFISLQVLWDMSLGRDVIPYGNDRIIHVVKENDIYWIHDGHHRFAQALVSSTSAMEARIQNLDGDEIPLLEDFKHIDGTSYADEFPIHSTLNWQLRRFMNFAVLEKSNFESVPSGDFPDLIEEFLKTQTLGLNVDLGDAKVIIPRIKK